MKLSILALGAALASISCANHCVAQLTIESNAPVRASEGRLVSGFSDDKNDFFGDGAATSSAANDAAYFAEDMPAADANDSVSLQSPDAALERSVLDKKLPVTSKSSSQAPLGVLANTPEVGMVPVFWPQGMGGCPTPNPVATMMTRNWCTSGLWDTYPCQNARQCQHIQQHIRGHNRYVSYGNPACSTCGVANVVASSSLAPNQALANCPQVPAQLNAQLSSVALPADVPTVPVQLQLPSAGPHSPAVETQPVPTMPLPTPTPVVASRASVQLR